MSLTISDKCSGHEAALAGGTTMHIDFALPPPDGDLLKTWENYEQKTAKAAMDYALHIAVTKFDEKASAVYAAMSWTRCKPGYYKPAAMLVLPLIACPATTGLYVDGNA